MGEDFRRLHCKNFVEQKDLGKGHAAFGQLLALIQTQAGVYLSENTQDILHFRPPFLRFLFQLFGREFFLHLPSIIHISS